MNGDNKYKLFRNFMVNELGITREDIERWTKEAVMAQVDKHLASGSIDLQTLAETAITRKVEDLFREVVFGRERFTDRNLLREAIAGELAARIEVYAVPHQRPVTR